MLYLRVALFEVHIFVTLIISCAVNTLRQLYALVFPHSSTPLKPLKTISASLIAITVTYRPNWKQMQNTAVIKLDFL